MLATSRLLANQPKIHTNSRAGHTAERSLPQMTANEEREPSARSLVDMAQNDCCLSVFAGSHSMPMTECRIDSNVFRRTDGQHPFCAPLLTLVWCMRSGLVFRLPSLSASSAVGIRTRSVIADVAFRCGTPSLIGGISLRRRSNATG